MTVAPPTTPARRTPARDRLLAAADELFYAHGINTVGVDRIIELAGVSRASFYNNFESKEELIHTYLVARQEGTTSRLLHDIGAHDDPRKQILAVFDAQAAQFRQLDFNGCAFMAASTEAPSGGLIESDCANFRRSIRTLFSDLARAAGAPDAEELGRQLHLLYDGAGLTARMDRDPGIAASVRAAVVVLLGAAIPSHSG
jgi:AcrR family transcriptional regulator